MSSSIYIDSKNVFLDTVNSKDYVQLDRVSTIYQALKDSIKKPLKMILLYGKQRSLLPRNGTPQPTIWKNS